MLYHDSLSLVKLSWTKFSLARMAAPKNESFAALLGRLAKERRLSEVGHESWDTGVRGTSSATLRKIREGKRLPNPPIIEAVARLVDRDPTTFPEYELAKGRRALDEAAKLLDENARGLEAATESLAEMRKSVRQLEDAAGRVETGRGARKLAGHARRKLEQRQLDNQRAGDAHADNGR